MYRESLTKDLVGRDGCGRRKVVDRILVHLVHAVHVVADVAVDEGVVHHHVVGVDVVTFVYHHILLVPCDVDGVFGATFCEERRNNFLK